MEQFETIQDFVDALEIWCMDNEVDLRINTKYHYTLMREDFRIDLWPKNQRYHIVSHPQERGGYDEYTLENFLDKIFSNKQNFS